MARPEPNYFLVNRKLIRSQMWLAEKFTAGQAWVDLLGLAQHKQDSFIVRGIFVPVQRGQLAYSMKTLAERWKWSQGKVKRFLENLSKNGEQISIQTNEVTTIITITNYDRYQTNGNADGEQTVSRRGTDGEQTGTYNKDKEVKEEKEEKKPRAKRTLDLSRFDEFWNSFGYKAGKANAAKAWGKLSEQDRTQCLANTPAWVANDQRRRSEGIMLLPASYLNGRRWEDEIVPIIDTSILDKPAPPQWHIATWFEGDKQRTANIVREDWIVWKRARNLAEGKLIDDEMPPNAEKSLAYWKMRRDMIPELKKRGKTDFELNGELDALTPKFNAYWLKHERYDREEWLAFWRGGRCLHISINSHTIFQKIPESMFRTISQDFSLGWLNRERCTLTTH